MARQDIVICLKNALERGETISEAEISLINAGYNRSDIIEAIEEIKGKVRKLNVPKPSFFPELPKPLKNKDI